MGPRSLPGGPTPIRLLPLLVLVLLASVATVGSAISELCFEKISDKVAIYMQEHPRRGFAVLGTQEGNLTLVRLPGVGSGVALTEVSSFLDLTGRVSLQGQETGLLSFAFHPQFLRNGRFFASYICNAAKNPDCKSSCGCNSKVGCTVGVRRAGCTSTTIISEYSAGPKPRSATKLQPGEARRILGFARPYLNHNGGHIFFGKDRMLYLSSGDGGSQGDPWNLAQNTSSFFGKILRINVGSRTNSANYTVPSDNPFRGSNQNPLVYALGLRNPWRCDQHPRSGAIICGDVGGNKFEEVNLIRKGGNYLWRNYEGGTPNIGTNDTSKLPGNATAALFSYSHNSLGGLGCIIGGVFYTSAVNPCLRGRYIYSDFSGPIWVATITGAKKTKRVRFSCSPTSPLPCPAGGDGSDQEWGEIYSWSKDLGGNSYLLTSSGIYRVANQTLCGLSC